MFTSFHLSPQMFTGNGVHSSAYNIWEFAECRTGNFGVFFAYFGHRKATALKGHVT
jgi:hypothetical protein